jgi:enolase
MYRSFIADYTIVSIEDPFDQDGLDSYTSLTACVKEQVVRSQKNARKSIEVLRVVAVLNCFVLHPMLLCMLQVGDNLLVTDPTRIQTGIDRNA